GGRRVGWGEGKKAPGDVEGALGGRTDGDPPLPLLREGRRRRGLPRDRRQLPRHRRRRDRARAWPPRLPEEGRGSGHRQTDRRHGQEPRLRRRGGDPRVHRHVSRDGQDGAPGRIRRDRGLVRDPRQGREVARRPVLEVPRVREVGGYWGRGGPPRSPPPIFVMAGEAPIPYRPTDGLSYDPSEAKYWDASALAKEVERTFEICHGCRLCFKYCDAFPTLFSLIDEQHEGDVRRLTGAETDRVMDLCFQCKLCEVQCPYTRREHHEFQLDFPALVHRHAAQQAARAGLTFRDRMPGNPDRRGHLARASLGLANLANRLRPSRWFLEKVLGIHRDKLLPPFPRATFEGWARRTRRIRPAPGGEAVLFQTCYVQHNEPAIG